FVCPDAEFIEQVAASMAKLVQTLEREDIVRTSMAGRGALIKVDSTDTALAVVNHVAPEHLELSVENAEELLPRVRHAGAIFLGRDTAEVLGDYCAVPDHVLLMYGLSR